MEACRAFSAPSSEKNDANLNAIIFCNLGHKGGTSTMSSNNNINSLRQAHDPSDRSHTKARRNGNNQQDLIAVADAEAAVVAIADAFTTMTAYQWRRTFRLFRLIRVRRSSKNIGNAAMMHFKCTEFYSVPRSATLVAPRASRNGNTATKTFQYNKTISKMER
jgi:hypothetical protein